MVAVGEAPRAPVVVASAGCEHARVIDTPTDGAVPADGTGDGGWDGINGGMSIEAGKMRCPLVAFEIKLRHTWFEVVAMGQTSALRDRSGRRQETSRQPAPPIASA